MSKKNSVLPKKYYLKSKLQLKYSVYRLTLTLDLGCMLYQHVEPYMNVFNNFKKGWLAANIIGIDRNSQKFYRWKQFLKKLNVLFILEGIGIERKADKFKKLKL